MRAKVLRTHNTGGQYQRTIGLIGKVDWNGFKQGNTKMYGLVFEEITRPNNTNGRFYYQENELKFLEEEDMKEFDWNDYKVAQCGLNGAAATDTFAIANQDAEKIKAFSSPCGVTADNRVLDLIQVIDGPDLPKYKLLVPVEELKAVFDQAPHKARQERREKKAELKKQMDQRVKEIQSTQIYEMLAEKDEALADMLKAFKEV